MVTGWVSGRGEARRACLSLPECVSQSTSKVDGAGWPAGAGGAGAGKSGCRAVLKTDQVAEGHFDAGLTNVALEKRDLCKICALVTHIDP